MSRIGNKILTIPASVTITVGEGNVHVAGPKGELNVVVPNGINVNIHGTEAIVTRDNDTIKNLHGTVNANLHNAIIGVTDGFEKKLEAVGVGYRFALKGNQLVITAGFSHPVEVDIPEGIKLESPSNTELFIRGIDKCLVGEYAANIRKIRKPEPYKGKGIRYSGEVIRRKVGKKAA
ncbi:MAG: 50S ribosomal protein L6 [Erysipelotrichaceae bacterium]|nr:50S ribosomal protein L6 [Erysipelotrichaceae bacterium]